MGQNTALTVPMGERPASRDTLAALGEEFAREHERTYGYRSDGEALQLVSLKVVGRGVSASPRLPHRLNTGANSKDSQEDRRVYFGARDGWVSTPVVPRASLAGGVVEGPFIVEEYDSTTVVPPGCWVWLDEWTNIVMEVSP